MSQDVLTPDLKTATRLCTGASHVVLSQDFASAIIEVAVCFLNIHQMGCQILLSNDSKAL